MSSIILRVRTQLGMWRITDVSTNDTFGSLKLRVEQEHKTDLSGRNFTLDANGTNVLHDGSIVREYGLKNGDMVFLMVDETKTGVHEKAHASTKKITKDGDIIAQEFSDVSRRDGFRPGMMALKDMKKQWTLAEFVSLDEQFVYRMKKPDAGYCQTVYADNASIEEFFQHVRRGEFSKMR